MPIAKRARKFAVIFSLFITGLAAVLFAVPLWLPWALRVVALRYGVKYASYERSGYSGFVVQGIGLTNGTVKIRADRVEGLVPTLWLWRCLRPAEHGERPTLRVTNWELTSIPAGTHPARSTGPSVYEDFRQTASVFEKLRRWLPEAALSNGIVQIGTNVVTLPAVGWSLGELVADVQISNAAALPTRLLELGGSNGFSSVSLQVRIRSSLGSTDRLSFTTPSHYEVQVKSPALDLQSDLVIQPNRLGLAMRNTNLFRGNRIVGFAQWGRRGIWPDSAGLNSTGFRLPADLAGLGEYDRISGSVAADWTKGQFTFELTAGANPKSAQTNLPPIELTLQARGDTNSVTITTARLSAGWFTAELSRDLRVFYDGQLLHEPAALKVNANLSRQPWIPVQGQLTGEADFLPLGSKLPVVRFQLSGQDAGVPGLLANSLRLTASLEWPRLDVTSSQAVLPDGSTADLSGKLNLDKRTVEDGRFEVRGVRLQRWLPAGVSCSGVLLSGAFQGPLPQLSHRGQLEITNLTVAQLRPLRVKGTWSGRMANLDAAEVELDSLVASVRARGALAITPGALQLRLTNLSLLTNGQAALELTAPCEVAFRRLPSGALAIQTSPFDWSGRGGQLHAEIAADWPAEGHILLSAKKLSSGLFTDFAELAYPKVDIRAFSGLLSWENGPAVYALESSLSGRWPAELLPTALSGPPETQSPAKPSTAESTAPNRPRAPSERLSDVDINVDLKLAGDENGLAISNLVIATRGLRVVSMRGFLPVKIEPGSPTNLVTLNAEASLECIVNIQPAGPFWNEFVRRTGFGVLQPQLDVRVSGSWLDPHGRLEFKSSRVQLPSLGITPPSLEDLRLSVELGSKSARVTDGRVLLQGQPLSWTAELPLDAAFWTRGSAPAVSDLKRASAHLQMKGAELAAFEPLYPQLLTPQGSMDVDLSLSPGLNLQGTVILQRARTRPLGQLGPIRDIGVKLRFHEQAVELETATASIGGSPIRLAGHADLHGDEWLLGVLPPFQLSLHGTDVILQRQPESIIRGDLDLLVARTNGAPPLVSGTARLCDSYYLSDLSALVPGKIATPDRRPPYFSITDPALADWRLAVTVEGVRFMKVRSALFNGVVSTHLKLQGTLRDPFAVGDGRVDSGYVRFPFATFQVQQGLVTLPSNNPYQPQLLVNAASKQYGYDIRMDLTGPVDAPLVQFNSTPPLSSEQILLMVTAGEMPQTTFSLTTQQRAQTVALFFGRDLLSKIGLGDQSQERLAVNSGQEVSEQGRPTYNVEYKLSDRWSVVGEYDRFGDFNAGFKWLLYSR